MSNLQNIDSILQLAQSVRNDAELEKELKENPSKVLDSINANRIPNNKVYQIVVYSLGAAVIISLLGAIAISLIQSTEKIPNILIAISSAAVGALAGLLAPQPGKSD